MSEPTDPQDPFEELALPVERQEPRPEFRRRLRNQLAAALGLDAEIGTVPLPERTTMSTSTTRTPAVTGIEVTPYLAVAGGAAAIDWYVEALGAVEQFRVVGDDGRLGHAEITIGSARIMLSDEYPEIDVLGPASLGGSGVALHLSVTDVDALYERAVAAGATGLRPPEDQPHGARHGTIRDPFGHRWMLSQPTEQVSLDEYAERSSGSGFEVVSGPRAGERYVDGIWSVVAYADVDAGIRFVTDVLGFEELVMARGPDGSIVHTEYRWPEGGIVQLAPADPDNPFVTAPGQNSTLYVVTQDPQSVWERCQAAGVEVVREPTEPHYDPGGMSFVVRDHEGNLWSFGSYVGGATD